MISSNDSRVVYIYNLLTSERESLAFIFLSLLRAKSKWSAYGELLQKLAKLEVDLLHYCESEIAKFADQYLPSAEVDRLVERFSRKAASYLSKTFTSVRALGSRVASGNIQGLEDERKAAEFFRKKMVSVITKNGRSYHYSLEYYISLIFHQTFAELRTATMLERARIDGSDLVRIVCPADDSSGHPCFIYEGTYSLAGKKGHTPYYTNAGGGPPYHPWCSATLEIVK